MIYRVPGIKERAHPIMFGGKYSFGFVIRMYKMNPYAVEMRLPNAAG